MAISSPLWTNCKQSENRSDAIDKTKHGYLGYIGLFNITVGLIWTIPEQTRGISDNIWQGCIRLEKTRLVAQAISPIDNGLWSVVQNRNGLRSDGRFLDFPT